VKQELNSNKNENPQTIEDLLTGNYLTQDTINFDKADQLLREGALLPQPYKTRSDFSNVAEYFKYLSQNDYDLYIALRSNPKIVKQQDEEGKTILHHAATIGCIMGSNSASLIHYLLFTAPGIDFNIQDKNGNTPVHIAALYSEDRVTCKYIFPNYVKRAAESNFNFSTLNESGQAVLHIATRISHTDPRGIFGRVNNVENVLKNAPDTDVNVLSSSGSTAFFYAVNHMHLAEARSLLDANANPMLCGAPDRNPLAMINKYIENLKQTLAQEELVQEEQTSVENKYIHKLENLKERVLSIDWANKQSKDDKFLFWAKTKETKEWEKVNTDSLERSNEPSDNKPHGPGYGL
jgi:ankyrin repeat protein